MAKILVLEDDKDLNKSVCTFLSLKNHEPIGFLNAEEAIESLERKLQNSDITSKDESLCNAIDSALNILKEVDLVL